GRARAAAHRDRVPAAALLHAPPERGAVEDAAVRACLRLRRRSRQQRDRGLRAQAARNDRRRPDRDPPGPGLPVPRRRSGNRRGPGAMNSLRNRLSLWLALVLVAAAALLAA